MSDMSMLPQSLTHAAAPGDGAPDAGLTAVDWCTATPATLAADACIAAASGLATELASELAVEPAITSAEQLLLALAQQARLPTVRIGEALLALGVISESKLGDALQAQLHDRKLPLGELLVRRGDVSRADLQTALAHKMGYPIVDIAQFPLQPDAARCLPLALARRLLALPLLLHAGQLVVALEDPSARLAIDEIASATTHQVITVLARAGTLAAAIETAYAPLGSAAAQPRHQPQSDAAPADHAGDSAAEQTGRLALQPGNSAQPAPPAEADDTTPVRLVHALILEAQQQQASHLHIECLADQVRVRLRIDGVLRTHLELPHSCGDALVARVKTMAELDVTQRRLPQQGRIRLARWLPGRQLDLRLLCMPTADAQEDLVLQLLPTAQALPLRALGIAPALLAQLQAALERQRGLLLCVGPGGSGTTSTLHAALAQLNTPQRKICTAEDPVAIHQPGLRQLQLEPQPGWGQAQALRLLLRADADVVMVGELRDSETTQLAVATALRGPLLLSTMHTRSAAATLTRLLAVGVDRFSLADCQLTVLAQRLVHRWCRHCVTATPADDDWLQALLDDYLAAVPASVQAADRAALLAQWRAEFGHHGVLLRHAAPGCGHCGGTGHAGQLGLHELLTLNQELRQLLQAQATTAELQAAALRHGMRSLRQDGILKVLAGQTAMAEVQAACQD